MDNFRVVERHNPISVHCLTWAEERCYKWISETGARYFPGVQFVAQQKINHKWTTIK